MKAILTIVLLIIGDFAVNSQTTELPSKIFAFDMRHPSHIYIDGKEIDFYVTRISKKYQEIFGCLNMKDFLLMSESSQDVFGHMFYDKLYLVDIYSTIIDTVYCADVSKGENIIRAYITPNDSILLINLYFRSQNKVGKGWTNSSLDLLVMDFKNKKIIDRLENFYANNSNYSQSRSYIFSPDGKQFVYSIENVVNIYADESVRSTLAYREGNGVYIYNLQSKRHEKIIDGGVNPIWSPDGNIIACYERKKVWFYDLKSKEKTVFYETQGKNSVVKIKWTPDGRNLYILTRKENWRSHGGILTHRLINVKNKSETTNGELMKLGMFFYWK